MSCPFYGRRGTGETTFHSFPDPEREPYRHQQWRDACGPNAVLRHKSAAQVFLRYRVCRRHFDADSLNGGCKRIRTTAVPTLHLRTPESAIVDTAEDRRAAGDDDDDDNEDGDDYVTNSVDDEAVGGEISALTAPSERADEHLLPLPLSGADDVWVKIIDYDDDPQCQADVDDDYEAEQSPTKICTVSNSRKRPGNDVRVVAEASCRPNQVEVDAAGAGCLPKRCRVADDNVYNDENTAIEWIDYDEEKNSGDEDIADKVEDAIQIGSNHHKCKSNFINFVKMYF